RPIGDLRAAFAGPHAPGGPTPATSPQKRRRRLAVEAHEHGHPALPNDLEGDGPVGPHVPSKARGTARLRQSPGVALLNRCGEFGRDGGIAHGIDVISAGLGESRAGRPEVRGARFVCRYAAPAAHLTRLAGPREGWTKQCGCSSVHTLVFSKYAQ